MASSDPSQRQSLEVLSTEDAKEERAPAAHADKSKPARDEAAIRRHVPRVVIF